MQGGDKLQVPLAEMATTILAVTAAARLLGRAEFLARARASLSARSDLLAKLIKCPHCLSFWLGLSFSVAWAAVGRLDLLQTCALVFLSWRLSYYFNRALDGYRERKARAQPAGRPCARCGTAYKKSFLERQGRHFCSHACWFEHLKRTLPRQMENRPLFDADGAFIRQETYPMSYANTTPAEAQALLQEDEGYLYIDVRSVPEFDNGHPSGAYNIPVMHRQPTGMTPNPDFLMVMQAHFTPDTKLLIGCQSGARSLRAAEALAGVGFSNITNVQGGFGGARDGAGQVVQPGWADSGLPVSVEAEEGRSYAELGSSKT